MSNIFPFTPTVRPFVPQQFNQPSPASHRYGDYSIADAVEAQINDMIAVCAGLAEASHRAEKLGAMSVVAMNMEQVQKLNAIIRALEHCVENDRNKGEW